MSCKTTFTFPSPLLKTVERSFGSTAQSRKCLSWRVRPRCESRSTFRPSPILRRGLATIARENQHNSESAIFEKRQAFKFEDLDRDKEGRERVIILGSGWAGYNLARSLNPKKFQAIVVSPRSYFVFTPLLASTSVGTLEFRTALEPVRSSRRKSPLYIQAWADDVDFFNKTVTLEEAVTDPRQGLAMTGSRSEGKNDEEVFAETVKSRRERRLFELGYDRLVVAVGCYSQTFNTPGVREHANFLKDVGDARKIRKTILSCFETAALPTTPRSIRQQLLNFAIVGGGPTGFEFSAELHDLIKDDLERLYPTLKGLSKITVHDVAPQVLSMFDKSLSSYAINHFSREGIDVKTKSIVESLSPGLPPPTDTVDTDMGTWKDMQAGRPGLTLRLKGKEAQGVGMVVWSTGLMANPFIAKALKRVRAFPSHSAIFKADRADAEAAQWHIATDPKTGSVITNDRLRVILEAPKAGAAEGEPPMRAFMSDVFALGDCASIERTAYPATAQVANQKATWLSKHLNKGDIQGTRFLFKNLGVMAYVGGWKAIFQGGNGGGSVSGRMAFLLWRTAYLVKSVSWRNKVLIPVYWIINWVFGRDISRF